MRELVFVVGMHRSGTSAVSLGLQALGLKLGEGAPLPPHFSNPKGYGELADVMQFHDAFLKAFGATWRRPDLPVYFQTSAVRVAEWVDKLCYLIERLYPFPGRYVVKDPRLCVLHLLWHIACEKLSIDKRVILTRRDPMAMRDSMEQRGDGLDASAFDQLLLLSIAGIQEWERCPSSRHSVIRFPGDFEASVTQTWRRVGEQLGIRWNTEAAADVYDRALVHHDALSSVSP